MQALVDGLCRVKGSLAGGLWGATCGRSQQSVGNALDTLDKSLDEAMTVQQPFWQGIETQRRIVGLLVGSGARGILRISVFGRRRSCTT